MAVSGKTVGSVILGAALLAGFTLYYLENFHWYQIEDQGSGTLQLIASGGAPEDIEVTNLRQAEGTSSPLKYRACFEVDAELVARLDAFTPAPDPAPTVAPRSFPCFDAAVIADALAAGTATGLLASTNVPYGIDRIVAITETGAGYAWHQINRCGERVFDGDPPPEGCPPPPAN